jgi:hypothetical protein
MATVSATRCPWCGAAHVLVHVHGHGQCATCGVVVETCCGGASAAGEADLALRRQMPERTIDPQFFTRLFAQLGGARATVTEAALLHACQEKLGGDLEAAGIVIEAACSVGALRRLTSGYRLP